MKKSIENEVPKVDCIIFLETVVLQMLARNYCLINEIVVRSFHAKSAISCLQAK